MTLFASIFSFHRQNEDQTHDREVIDAIKDKALSSLFWLMAALAFAMIVIVLITLWNGASPVLNKAGPMAFLARSEWYPTAQEFGLVAMVASTFAVSIGALLIAAPVAILCSLLLCYYMPNCWRGSFRCLLQLLAGIPSVVYGLWGLVVLIPMIAHFGGPGACLLAGVIILAIMILPTVAVIIENAIQQLPPALYQGALALGMPRYRAMLRIILPAIRGKVIAASILGLARAIGETMAVVMVTGNAINMPDGIMASVRTLSANIALEMAYALDLHRSALFAAGLALMLIVLAMLVLVDRLEQKGGQNV